MRLYLQFAYSCHSLPILQVPSQAKYSFRTSIVPMVKQLVNLSMHSPQTHQQQTECVSFSDSERNQAKLIKAWKCRSRKPLEAIIFYQTKTIKTQRLLIKLCSTANTSSRRELKALFENQHSLVLIRSLFQRHLNSQFRINKIINKDSINYCSGTSESISKIPSFNISVFLRLVV